MIQTGAWIQNDDAVLRILPYSARVIRVTCGAPDTPEPASFSVTALSSFASFELNIKLPSFKDLSTFNI